MNIHEYQAKELLRSYGVQTLQGYVASTPEDAVTAASKLEESTSWVVKAQICSGGRAKSGGVRFAESLDEVRECASDILNKSLITTQNGLHTKKVEKLLIEPQIKFDHEYFVAISLDRRIGRVVMLASDQGGELLDDVIENSPDRIVRAVIDPAVGYTNSLGRKLAYGLGFKNGQVEKACEFFGNLYQLYVEKDCLNLEINPFIANENKDLVALDAKILVDENALFRQEQILHYIDDAPDIVDADVVKGYSYLELDGNIGVFCNGAGLAMATIDALERMGESAANFIDLNGNATQHSVEKAFTTLLNNDKVKVIIVNIFGGIMKCDIVASGVISAMNGHERKLPLIVRMDGTHVALGKKLLKDSEIEFIIANDLQEVAEKALEVARKEA